MYKSAITMYCELAGYFATNILANLLPVSLYMHLISLLV